MYLQKPFFFPAAVTRHKHIKMHFVFSVMSCCNTLPRLLQRSFYCNRRDRKVLTVSSSFLPLQRAGFNQVPPSNRQNSANLHGASVWVRKQTTKTSFLRADLIVTKQSHVGDEFNNLLSFNPCLSLHYSSNFDT